MIPLADIGAISFSHAGQFQEMTGIAPDGDGLRVYFLGGADHILFRVEDRALAIAEVVGWVKRAFPAESSAGRVAA